MSNVCWEKLLMMQWYDPWSSKCVAAGSKNHQPHDVIFLVIWKTCNQKQKQKSSEINRWIRKQKSKIVYVNGWWPSGPNAYVWRRDSNLGIETYNHDIGYFVCAITKITIPLDWIRSGHSQGEGRTRSCYMSSLKTADHIMIIVIKRKVDLECCS